MIVELGSYYTEIMNDMINCLKNYHLQFDFFFVWPGLPITKGYLFCFGTIQNETKCDLVLFGIK